MVVGLEAENCHELNRGREGSEKPLWPTGVEDPADACDVLAQADGLNL